LSDAARVVLDNMEAGRDYGTRELRAIAPDASVERLREIMHELWVDRQVERAGDSAWRRVRSEAPHRPRTASGEVRFVKPEDLFDHDTFADFFK
jgi:hypothetical protein